MPKQSPCSLAQIIGFLAVTAIVTGVMPIRAEEKQPDKWDQAGTKIREATEAVGAATEESTDKAVEEALKAWEKAKLKYHKSVEAAKKKYDEEVEKARAKIHAATAPKNPDQAAEEEAPTETGKGQEAAAQPDPPPSS